MLASNGPFLRHALISTGKKDWPHDITEVRGSLAHWFSEFAAKDAEVAEAQQAAKAEDTATGSKDGRSPPDLPKGCWQTTGPSAPARVLAGNSSHVSNSRHHHGQSVLLFPDWVMLSDVCDGSGTGGDEEESQKCETEQVWQKMIAGDAPRQTIAKPPARRWVLPYSAVIVLCSHNKRDARCGIAAPMLAEVFRRCAEADGWTVDFKGEEMGDHSGTTSSSSSDADSEEGKIDFDEDGLAKNKSWGYVSHSPSAPSSPEQQVQAWRRRAAANQHRHHNHSDDQGSQRHATTTPSLGIFYTSHIGKHAWAGNVIVYFPNGAGVWYGRVDPLKGAGRVWQQTVRQGRVIPEYLRVGINLYRGSGDEEDAAQVKRESGTAVDGELGGILRW